MNFKWSERHLEEWETQGVTVFRQILPPALIEDLRRAAEMAREIARRDSPQAQRLQPVESYDSEIPQQPFRDYAELPALRDAVERLFSPAHEFGHRLAILFEPRDLPWCMDWHRDAREILDDDEWNAVRDDGQTGNQVNCALYEDTCTWIVPGSAARDDRAAETLVGRAPNLDGQGSAARERACSDYCRSMPGAERLLLEAGDYAIYRPWAWHLGNYLPSKKRATIQDSIATPAAWQWHHQRIWQRDRKGAEQTPYFRSLTGSPEPIT